MQVVFRAYDETLNNRAVALKVPQDAQVARKFRDTVVLSAKVNHPNVAKAFDYFEDDDGQSYMVEELVDGENLRQIASKFTRLDPHTAAHVLHHLARGVAASHRVGVVHRDLKPSNIMVAGGLKFGALKLTDFGIAKMAGDEISNAVAGGPEKTASSRTVMGALAYLAPEIIDRPHDPSKPADVWAIAAIAWELLTGAPPFGSGLPAIRIIGSGKNPNLPQDIGGHPQFGGLSRELHKVIMSCFEVTPDKRPTATELAVLCDSLCYLQPVREVGIVETYRFSTAGFIQSEEGGSSFFHIRNVIGPKPPIGTRVWFTKFLGSPASRAIPVVPFKT